MLWVNASATSKIRKLPTLTQHNHKTEVHPSSQICLSPKCLISFTSKCYAKSRREGKSSKFEFASCKSSSQLIDTYPRNQNGNFYGLVLFYEIDATWFQAWPLSSPDRWAETGIRCKKCWYGGECFTVNFWWGDTFSMSPVMRMFSGLISRWKIPLRCMWSMAVGEKWRVLSNDRLFTNYDTSKLAIRSSNGISVTFQKLVHQILYPIFGQVDATPSNELVGIHLHQLEDQTQLPSWRVAASSSHPLVISLNPAWISRQGSTSWMNVYEVSLLISVRPKLWNLCKKLEDGGWFSGNTKEPPGVWWCSGVGTAFAMPESPAFLSPVNMRQPEVQFYFNNLRKLCRRLRIMAKKACNCAFEIQCLRFRRDC